MSSQSISGPSSSPAANQPVRRQPRGSINRRACQKCRHLKIKCDGDAENNQPCTNCDYGTCVFDKSPRKNRQVERLNAKVENLENKLVETQTNLEFIRNDYDKKTDEYNLNLEVVKLEKQSLNLLFDCQHLFTDPLVFNQLRQAINESRCWLILLHVIHTLLVRLSQSQDNSSITAMLKNIAESAMNFCNPDDAFNPSATHPQNLIEEFQMGEMNIQSSFNTTISTATESVSTPMTSGMASLALQSPGSDAGSDMSNLTNVKLDLSPLLTPELASHLTPPMDNYSPYSQTYLDVDEVYFPFSVYESQYGSSSSNGHQ